MLNIGFYFTILTMVITCEIARITLTHVCFIALTQSYLHGVTQESVATEADHFTNASVRENVAGSYDIVSTL